MQVLLLLLLLLFCPNNCLSIRLFSYGDVFPPTPRPRLLHHFQHPLTLSQSSITYCDLYSQRWLISQRPLFYASVIRALSPCLNVQHHFFPRVNQQRTRVWFYSCSLCNHLLNFGVAHHLSGRCFLIASNWPRSSLRHFSSLCYLTFS